ncbi:alcohol dehydrogenase class-3-like isoform X3 [Anarhichas minor]|uniref:alcohol dehydrogenase class-3-like isoform X3 n=1 Tax=Anarhichas minor TaxID=65739 RepID=UPI003F741180
MSTTGQVIKCKAAVAWEPGKPLSVENVEVAPPKAHEVRIKVVAAGVCHTDWEYLYQTGKGMKFRPFPLVLGHEAAGIVESVGPEVTNFSPGDKVIPLFLPQCGECEQCQGLKRNQCRKNWENAQVGVLADGTSRISFKGQQVYQYLGVSSFCQYTVVPDICLAKLRSDAPLDKVCLLGWDVSTGYGAAVNACKVEKDSSCAVFGLGAVGLAAVMGCQAAEAKRIIAVDINPDKFEKARMLGATDCVNPNDYIKPIQQVLVELTDGGVDYALECNGKPVFTTTGSLCCLSAALESTTDGWGTCVIVGENEAEAMSVTVEKILMGRTLKGTYFGDWNSVADVPTLVDDYMNKLKLGEFIDHNLQLDQINTAFEYMKSGESIHTVISLWEATPTGDTVQGSQCKDLRTGVM